MRIDNIRIENFRCFKDEKINFSDYTCLIGANGTGKSTILHALNLFFRQKKDCNLDMYRLTADDYHHKNTSHPIKITVTFVDLSEKAQKDLTEYCRQGKLIVSSVAHYNENIQYADVQQFGNRIGFEDFRKYFEEDKKGAKVKELKDIYLGFMKKYSDLPKPGTKQDMIDALHEYEANHIKDCVLIQSEDQFYGFTKGTNRLQPYIQWVFVPATKDVAEESQGQRGTFLSELLSRTIGSRISFSEDINLIKDEATTKYQQILDGNQHILDDISTSLKKRLALWSHADISAQVLWRQDSDKSVRIENPLAYAKITEREYEGDLLRFGHGLQRSYLLAILQELAETPVGIMPTLLMGIEEPEIYQHPPQTKYLADTLQKLSKQDSQIVICSHSPHFVPGDDFETVRLVRGKNKPNESTVSQLTYLELAEFLKDSGQKALKESGMIAKLYPTLNPILNEMFFCDNLILVEGVEDAAYIISYLHLLDKFIDYRKYGCHIVPVGGKSSIIKPLAIAKLIDIPVFVMCDADTDKDQISDEEIRRSQVSKHKKDNKTILSILGYSEINEWPAESIEQSYLFMWKTNLTDIVKSELGKGWEDAIAKAEEDYNNPGNARKNPIIIAKALEYAWGAKYKSTALSKVVNAIIKYVASS